MRGPNWTDPSRGVTGEPSNYVTITDSNGMRKTFTGQTADAFRVRIERFEKDLIPVTV